MPKGPRQSSPHHRCRPLAQDKMKVRLNKFKYLSLLLFPLYPALAVGRGTTSLRFGMSSRQFQKLLRVPPPTGHTVRVFDCSSFSVIRRDRRQGNCARVAETIAFHLATPRRDRRPQSLVQLCFQYLFKIPAHITRALHSAAVSIVKLKTRRGCSAWCVGALISEPDVSCEVLFNQPVISKQCVYFTVIAAA